MSDVRSSEDLILAITDLQIKLANIESTLMIRTSRRPTGDIEPTIRSVPKPNTLFLRGQTLNRSAYPVLVQFVIDNGLFVTGLFSAHDGVTTFGLPDFQGKAIVGAGGAYVNGQDLGQDSRVISLANLTAHEHNIGGGTQSTGSHGGHINSVYNSAVPVAGSGSVAAGSSESRGDHWHGADGLWTDVTGSSTPFDVRQSSKAVNWMIYI